MKQHLLKLIALIFITAVVVQSCSKEDDDPAKPAPSEFIADDNTFKDFMTWSLDATHSGPDPGLGGFHLGNDSTVTRDIYFKNGQNSVNGKYPTGTLIVKHAYNAGGSLNEYAAMAKRGNNYNTAGGDWEYFVLDASGAIRKDTAGVEFRGFDLFSSACTSCHAGAANKDFVYSK